MMAGYGLCRNLIAALAALAASALCGCVSGETASRLFVEPEKYVLFNCNELATAAQTNFDRQHELELLMAKAGTGSGGEVASNLAYRPEYFQLRGEMEQMRKTAADKKCKTMPGAAGGARTSDQAVR
jgi:hypothetical protein